jgi:hypothetical protein
MIETETAPRYISLKDAPSRAAMGRSYFFENIRPLLTEYNWGRGVAFKREEFDEVLDRWAQERIKRGGKAQCSKVSSNVVTIGTSKRPTEVGSLEGRLAKLKEQRQKKSS